MDNIEKIISESEKCLINSTSPNEAINVLYNLITLKNQFNKNIENYKDLKRLICFYIDLIKTGDHGYDSINYGKLEFLLNYLNLEEQISIINFCISSLSRELPAHDRDWFIKKKNQIEIKIILSKKNIGLYPKALLLYLSQNFFRLVIGLLSYYLIIIIILLPSPNKDFEIFDINYHVYSSNFAFNHLLNVLSLFADLDNDFKVIPKNYYALLLSIIGKVFSVLIIVNFIYRKISDKIEIK